VTYNSVLRGAAEAPQWHRSLALVTDEVLDLMQADEVGADEETYVALIQACAAVGDVVNARVYWDEMAARCLPRGARAFEAMLEGFANAQALGPERTCRRYLTRPRGWPFPTVLGDPDGQTARDKTAGLEGDRLADPNKKFKGFLKQGPQRPWGDDDDDDFDENWADAFEAGELDEIKARMKDREEAEAEWNESNDAVGAHDETALAAAGNGPWREEVESAREAALDVIAKGEKKAANRLDEGASPSKVSAIAL
jgi:pentatricopeptide repeat protein